MTRRPSALAVSMGEPAGVGPELAVMAWGRRAAENLPAFFVTGCPGLIERRAREAGLAVTLTAVASPCEAPAAFARALPVLEVAGGGEVAAGRPDAASAAAVIAAIDAAVAATLAGTAAAVVTAPIQKETLYQAGFAFQGHTDYLAHLARAAGHAAEPVMMLVAGSLRTVPVTVHIPLKEVPGALTEAAIVAQGRVVAEALARHFGVVTPRIAVAGLNPHAGENGTIGREEVDIVAPAVAGLVAAGIAASGPHAADTLFHAEARARYDAALCMYHDQALIPIKTVGFHDGVNVTLGLPFIRTSPDHGTALALAGSGRANPSSFIAALRLAAEMAANGQAPG